MDHRKIKTLVPALVFSLIFLVPLSLQAETRELKGVLEREGIPFLEAYPDNPPVSGESPVTGLIWQGIYAPVLVVIDNAENAHPHWGVKDADVLYQCPTPVRALPSFWHCSLIRHLPLPAAAVPPARLLSMQQSAGARLLPMRAHPARTLRTGPMCR